ncbi:hypothetical protein CHISP_1715 [Chitinispirillum alkaliphilum]|nr:hypothetical protein CHISP_1715 [Chitinispirillum alkaliphilum]
MVSRIFTLLAFLAISGICQHVEWDQHISDIYVGKNLADSVTQYGITWYFDQEYPVGTFVNGDFWVAGNPVVITRITPDFDGENNGWEVNPVVAGKHGFQSGCYGGDNFDPALVPALPYTSPTDKIVSVVKTKRADPWPNRGRPCINIAAVLTVMPEPPPNLGNNVFRPPYVGKEKPLYRVDDLRTDLLPSLEPVGNPPEIEDIVNSFRKLRLDHKSGGIGRALRPQESMADYQLNNTSAIFNGALRFMLDDPIHLIMPAMIQYVQAGLDKVYTLLDGQTWPGGGGHQPGHVTALSFTTTLLDIEAARSLLNNADFFHASEWLSTTSHCGLQLWGSQVWNQEDAYWNRIVRGTGSNSIADPYGFIDGGPGPSPYQLLTAQSHKSERLIQVLMPELQNAWPKHEIPIVKNYAERWITEGLWFRPDPCAPFDGNVNNRGITYGPDPENPGMCILDTRLLYYNSPTDFAYPEGVHGGRFPERHNTEIDRGAYRNDFVAAMWDAYYERYNSLEQ